MKPFCLLVTWIILLYLSTTYSFTNKFFSINSHLLLHFAKLKNNYICSRFLFIENLYLDMIH